MVCSITRLVWLPWPRTTQGPGLDFLLGWQLSPAREGGRVDWRDSSAAVRKVQGPELYGRYHSSVGSSFLCLSLKSSSGVARSHMLMVPEKKKEVGRKKESSFFLELHFLQGTPKD